MITLDLGKKHFPKRRETDKFKLHQNMIFETVLKPIISDKVNPDYCMILKQTRPGVQTKTMQSG
jgi:hypothetical protein